MDRAYLRFAAACAALLALTTLLLWWLPQQLPETRTFEERLAIAGHPYMLARGWVGLLHMLLGFAAMLGAYLVLRPRSQGFALLGLAMFFAWMLVELVAVSLGLFAVNTAWRGGYAAASPGVQASFKTLLAGWPAVFDALYFVLALPYAIGSFVFGVLAVTQKGLTRLAGAFLVAGGVIAMAFLWSGYGGPTWPETLAGTAYPFIQPVGRAVLAYWLWQSARS